MASAEGHNRSLVFKVKLFLPTESEIGEGGGRGACDNDGSTNEGGKKKVGERGGAPPPPGLTTSRLDECRGKQENEGRKVTKLT
jgi:hypothetical protein